MKSGNKII